MPDTIAATEDVQRLGQAEFARAHGVDTRTDAYDMLLLFKADDDVLAAPGHRRAEGEPT